MKYLLDTHVLLWWLSNDPTLSPKIKNLINEEKNTVYVSAVNVWEIEVKKSLGKLSAPDNLLEVLRQNDFYALPISWEHADALRKLPLIHSDPFDRILVAQTKIEDLVLITRDSKIKKYKIKTLEA